MSPPRKLAPVVAAREVRAGASRQVVRVGGRELKPRETEVLQALADGERNEALAERFDITLPGVQKYVGRLMDLTGTLSRAHLIAFALRNGLIK